MALVFRTFKAASSGATFTQRATSAVKRVLDQIPSPSLDGLRTALRAARGGGEVTERTTTIRAAATQSKIAAAPTYPTTTTAAPPPDLAAALRTAHAKLRATNRK